MPDITQAASARQEMEKPSQGASGQPGSAMYPRQDLLQALLSEKPAHVNVGASLTWIYRHEGLTSAKAGSPKCIGRGGGKGTKGTPLAPGAFTALLFSRLLHTCKIYIYIIIIIIKYKI